MAAFAQESQAEDAALVIVVKRHTFSLTGTESSDTPEHRPTESGLLTLVDDAGNILVSTEVQATWRAASS